MLERDHGEGVVCGLWYPELNREGEAPSFLLISRLKREQPNSFPQALLPLLFRYGLKRNTWLLHLTGDEAPPTAIGRSEVIHL